MATTVDYCALLARWAWVVMGVVHAQRWSSFDVATGFWPCWCRLLAAVCRAVVGQTPELGVTDLPPAIEATRGISGSTQSFSDKRRFCLAGDKRTDCVCATRSSYSPRAGVIALRATSLALAATRMTCKHMLALHVPVTCQKHRAP
jgi:hypothetical protein